MALKIIWTPQAEKGLQRVLEYLEKEWTVQEILNLEQRLRALLERVSVSIRKFAHLQESIRMFIKDW